MENNSLNLSCNARDIKIATELRCNAYKYPKSVCYNDYPRPIIILLWQNYETNYITQIKWPPSIVYGFELQ